MNEQPSDQFTPEPGRKRGMNWADIEVVCENGGAPEVLVTGPTREMMVIRGATRIMVTTAYCRAFATATAIALKLPSTRPMEDTALDD